jgi:hypothetical protein
VITLAFYKGTRAENPKARVFDRLVCWRTGGRFSHCELVQDIISPHGLCWSASLRDGGVRQKWIDLASGRWELVTIPGDKAAAVAWFEAHRGAPYDWFGLLGWVVPWRMSVQRWWYCSESCGAAAGLPPDTTRRLSPSDLYRWAVAQQDNTTPTTTEPPHD